MIKIKLVFLGGIMKQKIILPIIILIILNTFITTMMFNVDKRTNQETVEGVITDQKIHISDISLLLNSRFDYIVNDVIYLKYLFEENYDDHSTITDLWKNFSNAYPYYRQLRYIDNSGFEVIRINQDGIGAAVVTDEDLQDKSKYYYFMDSENLKNGEIYLSRLDLNVENNQVVIPFQPTLRFVTPLYQNDKRIGLMVLNYNANFTDTLLENHLNMNSSSTISLINNEGYYLATSNKQIKLFDFMFDKNSTETFNIQYPDIFNQIKVQDSGQIITNDYLFVYKKVNIDQLIYETPNMNFQLVDNNHWYITMITSRSNENLMFFTNQFDYLAHRFKSHFYITILIIIFNILASISLSSFIQFFINKRNDNTYDALSNAYLRNSGLNKAKKLYQKSLEKNQDFGLIYIDLNDLKHVNDHHGHKAGDEMISILGYAVQENIRSSKKGSKHRENDLFVRVGGDEFIIVCLNIKQSEMEAIWDRIHHHLSQHKIDDHKLSASHGTLLVSAKDQLSFNEVLEKADALMYQEKQTFKNKKY